MARINDHILVQSIEGESVVFVDESRGYEVQLTNDEARRMAAALEYLTSFETSTPTAAKRRNQ